MKININNIANFIKSVNNPQPPKSVDGAPVPFIPQQKASPLPLIHEAFVQNNFQMARMTDFQINLLLRDLMSLPKEWSALLQSLTTNSQQTTNLLQLLKSNPKIDLAQLNLLLDKNSAGLLDKLIKLSLSTGMNPQTVEQLKDVLSASNFITPGFSVSQNDVIRNMMQMYLPWLPISDPNAKQLQELQDEFAQSSSSQEGELLFYLSTKNIGRFRVNIYIDKDALVEISIHNIAPRKQEDVPKLIIQKVSEQAKLFDIKSKLSYQTEIKNKEEDEDILENQLYVINSQDSSIVALLLLQIISKAVFEVDEKTGLNQIRQTKLDSKE